VVAETGHPGFGRVLQKPERTRLYLPALSAKGSQLRQAGLKIDRMEMLMSLFMTNTR
jgi:hypothetical protein